MTRAAALTGPKLHTRKDHPMQDQTELKTADELTLDEIVAELDRPYDGTLPERALRAAQQRREEITPRLIELIRNATEVVRAGGEVPGNGHFLALYLLTEFRAKEAWPAILEGVSLPGEGAFELFGGDPITEMLADVLVLLSDDPLSTINSLLTNAEVNSYVRWEAAQACLLLVRDEVLTREEAVRYLQKHLQDAIANDDQELASIAVSELHSYSPHEALDDILEAFRLDMVDRGFIGPEDIRKCIDEGESHFQRELEICRLRTTVDTVAELRTWASYLQESHRSSGSPPAVDDRAVSDLLTSWIEDDSREVDPDSITIRSEQPKVGRNDPCPCGSGRKYKKCCGKN
jgi:hypothetical protein